MQNIQGLIKILNYKEYRDFGLNLIAEVVLLAFAENESSNGTYISENALKCVNSCMAIVSEKAKVI